MHKAGGRGAQRWFVVPCVSGCFLQCMQAFSFVLRFIFHFLCLNPALLFALTMHQAFQYIDSMPGGGCMGAAKHLGAVCCVVLNVALSINQ